MTATVVSNTAQYPFGQMTNQTIARLIGINAQMARIEEAITSAASGYTGVVGTEFELPPIGTIPAPVNSVAVPTLFGVYPSETPGEQGSAYRYAFEQLNTQWQTFWTAAQPYIQQLDNGSGA